MFYRKKYPDLRYYTANRQIWWSKYLTSNFSVTYVIECDIGEHTLCSDLSILGSRHLEAGDLVDKGLSRVRDNLEHGTVVTHVRAVHHNGSVWKEFNKNIKLAATGDRSSTEQWCGIGSMVLKMLTCLLVHAIQRETRVSVFKKPDR